MRNLALKVVLFCVLISVTGRVQSQENKGIDPEQFDRLLRTSFTKVLSPIGSANLGSYASLDTENSEISLAASITPKNGRNLRPDLISFKLEGGGSEGLLPIFDDKEFATKVGGEIQFNFLTCGNSIIYKLADKEQQDEALLKIENEYRDRVIEIGYRKDSLDLESKKLGVESENYDLQKTMIQNNVKLEALRHRFNRAVDQEAKDTLGYQLRTLEMKVQMDALKQEKNDSTIARLANAIRDTPKAWKELDKADNKKLRDLKAAKDKFEITGVKIKWFSVGAGFSNTTFRLFDSTALVSTSPITDQFSKTSYLSPSLVLSYSGYSENKRVQYWSFAARYQNTDNSNGLTQLTIKDRVDYVTEETARYSETSTSVLDNSAGSYIRDKYTVRLSYDYYRFMNNSNGALHLNLLHNVDEGKKPQTNIQTGLFYSFKRIGGKEGGLVNAELFLEFEDVFETRKQNKKLFQRSGIGLRTTFPIAFN